MRRLALVAALLTGCATLRMAPDERRELPGSEEVVPGSAGGDVGATVSDWYARGVLQQPIDPNRPTFTTVKVRGTLTFLSSGTGIAWPSASWTASGNTISTDSNDGISVGTGGITATQIISSTVASGNNGLAVTQNGARIDFGAGASDYASSDGTTVTFAGPIASTTLTATTGTVSSRNAGGGFSFGTAGTQYFGMTGGASTIDVTGTGSLRVGGGTANTSESITVGAAKAIINNAPTISSGFGSSPSIVASAGSLSFEVNVGTGGSATSGVIGLPTATTGWNCACTDITTNSATVFLTKQTASSTTTCTVGNFNTAAAAAAWAASDKLRCIATAY